jgi:transposase
MDLSIDLRRRIVEAYQAKLSGTYGKTAELFHVGEATVSRLLRRFRETGDVQQKSRGGNNPRRVDLVWLRENLEAVPDARAVDRIETWVERGGERVSETAMYNAMHALGWTHKKRRWSPANATVRKSKPSARSSRGDSRG